MEPVQCAFCEHYIANSDCLCEAFPGGIPAKILQGWVVHDRPMPELGQKNDLVRIKKPGAPA